MKKLSAVLLIAALAVPSISFAATDGALGTTSTGSIDVSMTIVEAPISQGQISGLQDIDFGDVVKGTSGSDITINNICVHLNTAATYYMSIQSASSLTLGVGQLQLPGTSQLIQYNWLFEDGNGAAFGGGSATGLSGNSTAGCTSGHTASLKLVPQLSGFESANTTPFSDLLTLTLAPE